MSLKAFHIVFITASTLLSLVLALWGFHEYREAPGAWNLVIGIAGAAGLVLLIPYFRWFQKKMSGLSSAVLAAFLGSAVHARAAHACAVCFGDPNSLMSQGIKSGVLVLIGVVGLILGTILGVTFTWVRRARKLAEQ